MQGAVNDIQWQSTAYAQRGMLFDIQYYINWQADDTAAAASSLAWINGLQGQLDQLFTGHHSYVRTHIPCDLQHWLRLGH